MVVNGSSRGGRIRFIIGLGNPQEYANTYHNVGKAAVAYLSGKLPATVAVRESSAYMNVSGRFVARALARARIKPEHLLIAHDDSDLMLGSFKLDFGRGAAGHHGIESVIAALGTKNFWRLRIGIRPPAQADLPADLSAEASAKVEALPRAKAGSFVLKKISKDDAAVLRGVLEQAGEKIRALCASPRP